MINGITHNNIGKPIEYYSIEQLKQIEEVYICFNFLCNLSCNHCTLYKIEMDSNYQKIYEVMTKLKQIRKDITFNLFGGEPLLAMNKDFKIFKDILSKSSLIISTNLLSLNNENIEYFYNVEDVNTSWNPTRFTKYEYKLWLENLKILQNKNISYTVMITLTKDLIQNVDVKDFLNLINSFKCRNLDLKFMIGDSTIDFNEVDNWLCDLYDIWNIKTKCLLFEEIEKVVKKQKIWKNKCEAIGTIYPNGNLKLGCPYFEFKEKKDFCLMCEYYSYCKGGCNIQQRCAFPKKLFNKVLKAKKNDTKVN